MSLVSVGIDVACKTLAVSLERPSSREEAFDLLNNQAGHLDLIKRMTRRGAQARVVLEASGNYHLRLALALNEAPGVEVMVVNPRAARNFAQARMCRSKTDTVDAAVLREFAQRMPFQSWTAPDRKRFELRTRARRIASLTAMQTEEKNRLHAAEYTDSSDVCNDIRVHIRFLGRRLEILKGKAFDLIQSCPELARKYARMTSVRGIAINSAIQILGELCVLAEDMTPRQWVAFAGLDPRIVQSGTSVKAPTRISKQGNRALRSALYMPALTAIRYEPNVKAFYEKLLAREKERMQGVVAVMRKLLHAIHGMLRTDTDFDGQKFYREPCA